ncbi:MAG: hypothetical protein ACKO8H_21400 [Microcystis panniformis]
MTVEQLKTQLGQFGRKNPQITRNAS